MIWEPHDPLSYLIHVSLGPVAFLAGLIAISTKKGSRLHKKSGLVFSFSMLPIVISTLIFMTHELIPLAIVMCVAVIYGVTTAYFAVHNRHRLAIKIEKIFIILPAILALFVTFNFIRFLSIPDAPKIGPLLMGITFWFILIQDAMLIYNRPNLHVIWIRRHMVRMVLAFTFTLMAIVRIGINFGLSFEVSVIYPLLIAWGTVGYFYFKYPTPKQS